MKKFLAMASAVLLLAGSLLMPASADPAGTRDDWVTGETAGATFNPNGTITAQGNGAYLGLNKKVDLTANNLDVSWTLRLDNVSQAANADADNFCLYLSDSLGNAIPSSEAGGHVFRARFFVNNNGKAVYSEAIVDGTVCMPYGGTDTALKNTNELTLRLTGDGTTVQLYINDQAVYYGGTPDAVKNALLQNYGGGAYLSLSLAGADTKITVLKVNGQTPLEPETEEEKPAWITSDGVTVDKAAGTFSMNAVEYAIRTEKIDFTAADLDVSVTLKTSFGNANQFISLYFSQDLPAGKPEGEKVAHIRFGWDNGKFALNHAWLGAQAIGAYCGGYVDHTDDTLYTIRFKRVDGMIRMYLNDTLIYGNAGNTDKTVSDFINGLGTGYLTIGTNSFDGGFTTQVLQVNGKPPMVPPAVINIEMAAVPTKTIYEYGEDLSVDGGSVKLLYDDGTDKTIPLTAAMVSGYSSTTAGEQTLTVTCEDKTTSFRVTVKERPAATVTGITMKANPAKTTYACGEELDLTGAQIEVSYSYGDPRTLDVGASMVSGYDKAAAGRQTITVAYDGKTTTFEVVVQPAAVTGIAMKTLPVKTTYQKGEELDLTGAQIEVSYSYGDPKTVEVTADMVSGYDKNTAGKQTITVTYEGKTAVFDVVIPLDIEDKDKLTKEDWIVGPDQDSNEGRLTTTAVYNQDGSIKVSGGSGSKGAYIGLNEKIDLTAADLDVSWKIRLDQFPIVDEADQANIQFILSDSLTGYNPLYVDEATAFRARIYRSYGDEFTFPEAMFRNPKQAGTPGGALMAYAGRTIDLDDENAPTFTFQIKRVEGKIRFLIDGETLYTADGYDKEDRLPAKISQALEKEFAAGAYLSIACASKAGEPVSFTILEVNGGKAWEGGSGGDISDPDDPNGPDDPVKPPVTGVVVPVALLTGLAASGAAAMLFTSRRRKNRG